MRLLFQTIASFTCGVRYSISMYPTKKIFSEPSGGAHGGRGSYNESTKLKYLNMSIAEKRNLYVVRRHVELGKIPSWSSYKPKNRSSKKLPPKELPDEELNQKVSLFKGNITELEIDAIVNAANSRLAGGGGVDGAIHDAADWALLQAECRTLRGCPTGQAKATGGYRLPARYVIHTVGPQDDDEEALHQCYVNSLAVAREIGARTVAFPCISTGIYGFPNDKAARVALATVRKLLESDKSKAEGDQFERIIFCVFLDKDSDLYEQYLPVYFPRGTSIIQDAKQSNQSALANADCASNSSQTSDSSVPTVLKYENTVVTEQPSYSFTSARSVSLLDTVSKPEAGDLLTSPANDTNQGAIKSAETLASSEHAPALIEDPTTESEGPTAGSQDPTAGSQDPTTESEGPTAGSEGLTTESEGLTAGSEGPTAGSEGPTAGSQDPTTESEGPTAGSKGLTAGSEGPTAGSEGPTAGSQDPTAGSEGPTAGSADSKVTADKESDSASNQAKDTETTEKEATTTNPVPVSRETENSGFSVSMNTDAGIKSDETDIADSTVTNL